jgi:hypothetical protein
METLTIVVICVFCLFFVLTPLYVDAAFQEPAVAWRIGPEELKSNSDTDPAPSSPAVVKGSILLTLGQRT